jgi:hypothetical protein
MRRGMGGRARAGEIKRPEARETAELNAAPCYDQFAAERAREQLEAGERHERIEKTSDA